LAAAFLAADFTGLGARLPDASLTARAGLTIRFATIFWTRGFAVAVYTHALYDLYVLLVR